MIFFLLGEAYCQGLCHVSFREFFHQFAGIFFHPLDRNHDRWEPQLGSPILPRRREDANRFRAYTTWDDEGGIPPPTNDTLKILYVAKCFQTLSLNF